MLVFCPLDWPNSLQQLMVAAIQQQNNQTMTCHMSYKACKLCSLRPSRIDWLDKCMFPDVFLWLCEQMMMHAVAAGEQCQGVAVSQGREWINTDRQADRSSVGHRPSVCTRSASLPVCLSALALCSVLSAKHNHFTGTCCLQLHTSGNKIWKQFVYFSLCVCVCKAHIGRARETKLYESVCICFL